MMKLIISFMFLLTAVNVNTAGTALASPEVMKERLIFPDMMYSSDHDIVTVSIRINPPPETKAYVVEDSIPAGLNPVLIGDQGAFDNVNRKVKFGPFFDNQERLLIYHLDSEKGGEYNLQGWVSFDGSPPIELIGMNKFQIIEGSRLEGFYIDEMRFRNKLREIGDNFWDLSDMIGNPRLRD